MSKVRDISNLSNVIRTDASGNVSFVSGSTTLMAISSSGAVTSTGTIGGSNSATLATTGSNTFTGQQYISNTNAPVNFTDTASLYTDGGLRVGKDAYVSGTLYLNNLTVYGTQSVNFITSSQLDIADNIITVNTSTPQIRFGGIAVRDSGSAGTGLTGSLLWDSQNNHWIYTNPSGSSYSGGMLISGPRNTGSMGDEQGTTLNAIMKGMGGDHITSSGIFESGSNVGIGTSNPSLTFHINKSGASGPPVSSSTTPTGYAVIGSTFNNNLYMGSYATTPYGFWMQGQDATNLATTYPIILQPIGGKVGIGTTSPTRALTVQASDDDVISWRTPSYEVGRLGIDTNNAHGWIALYSSGSYKVQITARPNAPTYFNAGNVGIGTDTPSTKLEVIGDTIISGSATAGGLIVQGVGTSATGTSTIKVRNGGYGASYNSILASGEGSAGFLQLGNNGNNEIIGGSTLSGGYLKFWVNNTNYAPTAPNGTLAMVINSAGFVTHPINPSFSMWVSVNTTGPGVVPFGGTNYNDGGYFNTTTYRFTAPIAGRYFFSFYCNVYANSTAATYFTFRVNATYRGAFAYYSNKSVGNWHLASFQQVIKLDAGDYVDVFNNSVDRCDYGSDAWGNFSGHLLG
jgi:hypothetical protein